MPFFEFFFFYKTVINSAYGELNDVDVRETMLSLFNMEMQAGGLDGKQQRRNISEAKAAQSVIISLVLQIQLMC